MPRPQDLSNLKKIRQISKLLDSAISIPGTKFRFGIDPIIGLIPGGGDLIAALISGYIIFLAFRLGVAKEDLLKMIQNVALETILGSIPVVGDVFDAYFKANLRNLEIVENSIVDTDNELSEEETFFLVSG